MNKTSCCFKGLEILTPMSAANRPGLNALKYRVGTHASFLETMKTCFSSSVFLSLANLKTRNANDPAIAFLDAWATVADVLTFYQERIANEGYLRTATERRSVLELARLVGYRLRPGVAATVYPAFTMETGYNKGSEIPAGNRIQSLPGIGEMPQFFETAEKISARADWNNLQPRLTRPHFINRETDTIYFQGITTNLKPNDAVLFVLSNHPDNKVFRQVKAVEPQAIENRTKVELQTANTQQILQQEVNSLTMSQGRNSRGESKCPFKNLGSADEGLLKNLLQPPSIPPANALQLGLTPKQVYKCESDIAPQILTALKPRLTDTLYTALQNTLDTSKSGSQSTQAFRVKAAPFGANAPLKPVYDDRGRIQGYEEWAIAGTMTIGVQVFWDDNLLEDNSQISFQRDDDETISVEASVATSDDIPLNPYGIVVRITRLPEVTPDEEVVVPRDLSTRQVSTRQTNELRFEFFESVTGQVPSDPTSQPLQIIQLRWVDNNLFVRVDQDRERFVLRLERALQEKILRYSTDACKVSITSNREESSLSILCESPAPIPNDSGTLKQQMALDALYEQITVESWVAIQRPEQVRPDIYQVTKVETVTQAKYGITAKVTQLTLDRNWLKESDRSLSLLRQTTVYAQSEELRLAEEVIDPKAEPVKGSEIELGALYDGLQPGRWLIVSGERADLGETTGVKASELVMLSSVTQRVTTMVKSEEQEIPGDKTHTFLHLAQSLAYKYKRDTVTVYGNVVKATHGEMRTEILGSGDGSKAFQQFPLRQPPLTYIPAPTPEGAASTLEVRVNDILWYETETLAGLKPTERAYITKTDDDGKNTVIFGTRLPTGVENIRAVYRSGIGQVGNVKAEQISLLASRPLGLKAVINPLPATGGADRESRDQARKNAPLQVMALNRLVSVQDYADFARTFAGIGKASAMLVSDGRRQVVHLTIAGVDDIPIDEKSDLYRNLYQALRQFGDPNQPVRLELRELMVLFVSAKVKILPDYQWESVEPQLRQTLLDTFSFERRELGQDVTFSEVISTMQKVPGVDFVDVDILDSVSETEAANPDILIQILEKLAKGKTYQRQNTQNLEDDIQPRKRITVNFAKATQQMIQPAQLAVLVSSQPLTLILNPLKENL
ncbi:hypothetical protein WA1_47495 [Scytonema hofmannii PCC 7110]|uniref:Uncharacterized protein n=1 Tax=Scytonema hofmannii PCC 7110 TaxID=128403 RepID=A0A139WXV2_9CYAN|nr:putative baseplate assembly protein [Scytonema hofmannii]KYC37268.1 hypothetical protein WA1_47495 [Scytonema hofmannii PCC 7110]